MKSQIYTVPPTPVQEYQEALIFLWMIFLFTTITLLGLLTPHSGRCLSGCPGHSDNFHSRPSSGPVQDTLADISLDVPPATPTRDLPPVQDTPTGVSPSPSLSSQRRIVREQGVSWNDSQIPPG